MPKTAEPGADFERPTLPQFRSFARRSAFPSDAEYRAYLQGLAGQGVLPAQRLLRLFDDHLAKTA